MSFFFVCDPRPIERIVDVFICVQVYVSYLIFQLFSHKDLYDDKGGEKFKSIRYAPRTGPSAKERTKKFFGIPLTPVKETKEDGASEGPGDSSAHILRRQFDDDVQPAADVERRDATTTEDVEEDEEIPELSLSVTIILLVLVTVLVAVTAEWLVDSIDGLASGGAISKEFIGLILLPIVGNAAEHATAVTVSVKDKLTLSLGVAVGSSIVSSFSLSSPPDRRQCVTSLAYSHLSSKSHYLSFRSSSSSDGLSGVRSPCSSTRSSRSSSSFPC